MANGGEAGMPSVLKPNSENTDGRPSAAPEKSGAPHNFKTFSGYGDGPAYWNERYKEDLGTWDWVGQWQDVAEIVCRAMEGRSRDQLQILHVGCGNSELAEGMYASGFQQITSIDNSDVVIEQMRCRSEARQLTGLRWLCMDVTDMGLSDWSFDAVLDKCLLDALACADDADVQLARYLKEVIRVLRPGGSFICVSLNAARAELLQAGPWKFQLEETMKFGTCVVCVCRKTEASEDFLARWPELLCAISRGLTPHDFELVDAEGSWARAEGLEAGDVVEVESAFTSGDEPCDQVRLPEGLRGIVRVIDEDGDAIVRFPRLPEAQRVDRFVMQAQLLHLRKRLPPDAARVEG